MHKIKELFDHVEALLKSSKYHVLAYGQVIEYNDEGYSWSEGSRPQSPYEVMADYLNETPEPNVEGFTDWSKTHNVSVLHKEYEQYADEEEDRWDEYNPFVDMTLYDALAAVPD